MIIPTSFLCGDNTNIVLFGLIPVALCLFIHSSIHSFKHSGKLITRWALSYQRRTHFHITFRAELH